MGGYKRLQNTSLKNLSDTYNFAACFLMKHHDLQDKEIETLLKLGVSDYLSSQSSDFLVLYFSFPSSYILIKATLICLDTESNSCLHVSQMQKQSRRNILSMSVLKYFATPTFIISSFQSITPRCYVRTRKLLFLSMAVFVDFSHILVMMNETAMKLYSEEHGH